MSIYTAEEKAAILAAFDLEIADRTRLFEAELEQSLHKFLRDAESHVDAIPPLVRNATLEELDKYGGDIDKCFQARKRAWLESDGTIGANVGIGPEERKRKWAESAGLLSEDGERNAKNARLLGTPKGKTGLASNLGSTQRARLLARTPGGIPPRFAPSPGSQKIKPTTVKPLPSKYQPPPSRATFAPPIPSDAPPYPRLPRKGESMLSVNGSPIALPPQALEVAESSKSLKRTPSIRLLSGPSQSAPDLDQPVPSDQLAIPTEIRITTKAGTVLSLDGLRASPGELWGLEGISTADKHAAMEDIARMAEALRRFALKESR